MSYDPPVRKLEDDASVHADAGVPILAVRKAAPSNTSGTDGDFEFLQMSGGRVWCSVAIDTALPAGANLIGKVGFDQTTPGTTNGVVVNYVADSIGGATQITAIDAVVAAPGDNGILRSGASTAGSYVAQAVKEGHSNVLVQVGGGTWTTVLYFEGSIDSTNGIDGNWISITMSQEGENDNVVAFSTTATLSLWRGPCAGLAYVRVRAVGGSITSGPNCRIRTTAGRSVLNLSEPLPAGANTLGTVNAPTLTKGTQGATGFSVQPLRDAGRVAVRYFACGVAAGTTGTETAISLTRSADNGATSAAVSHVITAGKRFRITHLSVAARGHATGTAQVTTFSVRVNTAGAVITTTTPIEFQARVATPATASAWDRYVVAVPDGWEILGDGTLQFGVTANAVYVTNAPTWDVQLIGFEY